MTQSQGSLANLRVLDLAGPMGAYCTKLLAGLGADVIKIEPSQGDVLRARGPFYQGVRDPEASLAFWHYHASKRSVTLNLELPQGQDLFRRLARTADIVVETFPPGYLAGLGLGYADLERLNPRLILTSITAFGQEGPYRDFKGADIVGVSMGGHAYIHGTRDRPPLAYAGFQGFHQASLHGLAYTLIALCARDLTGVGQHVDVSMQAACAMALPYTIARNEAWGDVRRRGESVEFEATRVAFGILPCADGYVYSSPTIRGVQALVRWLEEEGVAQDLTDSRWGGWTDAALLRQKEAIEHFQPIYRRWLLGHTKVALCEEAQRRGISIVPVADIKDVVEDPQLGFRGFFVPVAHPELGRSLTYPGPPIKFAATPWQAPRRAPRLGEHNAAVYQGELGLSPEEVLAFQREGVL
ncbi:MAG: CoA transferase [Chloroflexi bacterium]|nr:CoA transferase [Chloroflexota bacterium]